MKNFSILCLAFCVGCSSNQVKPNVPQLNEYEYWESTSETYQEHKSEVLDRANDVWEGMKVRGSEFVDDVSEGASDVKERIKRASRAAWGELSK